MNWLKQNWRRVFVYIAKRGRVFLLHNKTLNVLVAIVLIFYAFIASDSLWWLVFGGGLVIVLFFKKDRRFKIYIMVGFLFVASISFLFDKIYQISKTSILEDATQLEYTFSNKAYVGSYLLPEFFWPAPCSKVLPYDVIIVGDEIEKAGIDRKDLLNVVRNAEKRWEDAVGLNLFEYSPYEDGVVIGFLEGSSDDPGGKTISSYGLLGPAVSINVYLEPEEMTLDFLNGTLGAVVLHEIGHIIGLPHLPKGMGIMSINGSDYPSGEFSEKDIMLIKEFCKNKILSIYRI